MNALIPAIRDHQCSELQHGLRILSTPERHVVLESHNDHTADAAFDGSTAKGKSEPFADGVDQSTRLAMFRQIGDLRYQIFIAWVRIRMLLQFLHDVRHCPLRSRVRRSR